MDKLHWIHQLKMFIFSKNKRNSVTKIHSLGICLTRKAMAIGTEKRIDTHQINVIINLEMYFGGRALKMIKLDRNDINIKI